MLFSGLLSAQINSFESGITLYNIQVGNDKSIADVSTSELDNENGIHFGVHIQWEKNNKKRRLEYWYKEENLRTFYTNSNKTSIVNTSAENKTSGIRYLRLAPIYKRNRFKLIYAFSGGVLYSPEQIGYRSRRSDLGHEFNFKNEWITERVPERYGIEIGGRLSIEYKLTKRVFVSLNVDNQLVYTYSKGSVKRHIMNYSIEGDFMSEERNTDRIVDKQLETILFKGSLTVAYRLFEKRR